MRWLLIAAHAAGCSDTTTVRITFTGSGTGSVSVFDARTAAERTCTESCELTFPSGFLRLSLHAGYNPRATAVEIGGPDIVEGEYSNTAEVGPLEGDDLEVTVRFTSWEEAPLACAASGVFAPDGDLIVGTHFGVAKVALAGDVAWSNPLTPEETESANVNAVEVTSAGEIFARHVFPQKLTKLAADGTVMWSMELAGHARDMAVTPAGDLAVLDEEVRLFRGTDGSQAWSTPVLGGDSVTVGPDGVIYVAKKEGFPLIGEIVRFTGAGAPLTPSFSFPVDNGMHAGLAIDQAGALLVASYVHLRLDATTGAVLSMRPLSEPEQDSFAADRRPGVAVTSSNQALVWMSRAFVGSHGTRGVAGTDVRTIDPSGMETWFTRFPALESVGRTVFSSGIVTSGTCDRNKHCAVFGTVPATIFDVP